MMSEIHVEATHEAISTLDEPIKETILRDVKAIGKKVLVVVFPPLSNNQELRDWDLWGPLVLCLMLAIILASAADFEQGGLIFSAVFVLVWIGGLGVTLNAKFLKSQISFFQTICVMGYCLAPICAGALFCLFIPWLWMRFITMIGMWAWACWAALRFFRGTTEPEREMLVVYPVALFYTFISWMVMVGV